MSLKNDYYLGKTGLLAQMDMAFEAGVAYVGSAVVQIDNLSLGNVGGAALVTGSTGLYFDTSSPSTSYRVWFNTGTETAPSAGTLTLVPVSVLASDTPVQVASKAAAAINLIANQPIVADSEEEVIVLTNVIVGPGLAATSNGTLGGTSYVDHVQVGVATNGNYAALQSALTQNAAAGLTHFIVTLPVSYQPQYLRGSRGSMFPNSSQFMQDPIAQASVVAGGNTGYGNDPSNNLIRQSFFAGVHQGLANNQIYDFECALRLNTTDQLNLGIDFIFMFQTK